MAKAVFVQKGENIDYTASSAVDYMEVVPMESCVGVALEPIAAGGTGTVSLTGVYELPAAADLGTGISISPGDAVYWNTSNSNIDKDASGVPAGIAVTAKTGTSVRVKLHPFPAASGES